MRHLLAFCCLVLAAGAARAQDCPPGATLDARQTCTAERDGRTVVSPARPLAQARRAGGDSIQVPLRLFLEEVIFTQGGEERHAVGYFYEWEHAAGAAFYHVDGHYPDGPQVFSISRADLQTFGPRDLFPRTIESAPGHLVYFTILVSSAIPADEPGRSNSIQSNRDFARESTRPDTHPWAMYASGFDAFDAEVAFSRDTVAVGGTFQAYVITRHRRNGTIDNVRLGMPLALAGDGEVRVDAGPVPAALASVAQADPDTLAFTLVAEAEGVVTVAASLLGRYSRYYPDDLTSRSRCGEPGHRTCRVVIGPGGMAFTAESAFMEADSLFWPDTTYTLRWTAEGTETVEIHASLKRNPDPEVDTDWPIVVTTGLDASLEALDWTVPQGAVSPTVRLRIRDADDADTYHVSEQARVRYGWHLTRIAIDASGEQTYELFDPAFHGWQEQGGRTFFDWIGAYASEMGPENKDVVASEARGQLAELDITFHQRFWPRLFTFATDASREVFRPSMVQYLNKRRNGVPLVSRGSLDLARRTGTPSLRSASFAYGLPGVYGSASPVLVDSPSPDGTLMSQIDPGFGTRYRQAISSGKGLCYGLAWSALLAFQKPAEFADRYRPLAPSLGAVRRLSTVPLTSQTLDVIGAVFTVQERSLGTPPSVSGDQTMSRLQDALVSDEPDDDIVLSNSGHAVLPYRVTQSTATSFAVHVHNRTTPGEAESSRSRFAYSVGGTIDANYQPSDENMADFFVPLPAATSSGSTVRARSGAEIRVTSTSRRGQAPRAITLFRNDPDLPPVGYIVPEGPFQFTLRNARDSVATATVSLSDGTTYDVSRFDTRPGEVDSLVVSDDALTYVGAGSERTVTLGLSSPDVAGYRSAEIGELVIGDGESSSVGWNGDGVRVRNGGPAQTYEFALIQSGGDWSFFTATFIEIGSGAIHTVRPDWSALEDGEITIEVDDDGDGVPDRTISVSQATADEDQALPSRLALHAPYPNPAASTVTIPFALPTAGSVRLSVVDVLGREVAVLVAGVRAAGEAEAAFDTARLGAGVYVVRLEVGGETATRTLTVVR